MIDVAIRISSNQFMYNYQKTLNKSYAEQQKLFEQADGSSIHRASDDPVAYAKVMSLRYTESENTQYNKNVKSALSWMKETDNSIGDMKDNVKTFVEKTIQAANDYETDPDFKSIAGEMMAIIEDVVTNCNNQQGDRYLFAGQKDTTHPFIMSKDTFERGLAKTLDAKQAEFFKGTSGDINAGLYQMLQMKDSSGNVYYFDTESGYVYEKDFVEEGYKEVISGGRGNINAIYSTTESDETDDDGNPITVTTTVAEHYSVGTVTVGDSGFKVSDAFNSQGLLRDEISMDSDTAEEDALFNYSLDASTGLYKVTGLKVTLNNVDAEDEDAVTTLNLSFTTVNQRIVTYSGDTNHISMVKLNGPTDGTSDIVNMNGQDMWGTDIFDNANSGNESSGAAMLNNMITVYVKTYDGDAHWLDSDGVTLANVSHSTLNIAQTTLGSRMQLYTAVDDMLENQSTIITGDLTDLSGADIAKLGTKLMEHTVLYNLALALGGRVLPQSLADYL